MTCAHPPGNLKGLVYGMVFRRLQLTSNPIVQIQELQNFYTSLIARGYNRKFCYKIMNEAYQKINTQVNTSTSTSTYCRPRYCHFPISKKVGLLGQGKLVKNSASRNAQYRYLISWRWTVWCLSFGPGYHCPPHTKNRRGHCRARVHLFASS
jgi:hypothetical protein